MINIVAIISLSLLLSSCGEKSKASSQGKKESISIAEINKIMNNQKFTCASIGGKSCPSGIAKMAIVDRNDKENSQLCTGFMVDEETLVTNNHCLSTKKECKDTYIAIYDGNSYLNTKCKSIVKTFQDDSPLEDDDHASDYTILKVENKFLSRTFYPANRDARTGDDVTVWAVDHLSVTDARIIELDCIYYPNSINEKYMRLRNCPVISGNSGAPVLNTQGQVVGLFWGSFDIPAADGYLLDEQTPIEMRRATDGAEAFATPLSYFRNYL
jgi:V8-like Glu-specific endopeptidase